MLPTQLLMGLRRVANQEIDFRWAEVAGVDFDQSLAGCGIDALFVDAFAFPFQGEAGVGEGPVHEGADGGGFAGGEDIIIWLVLLHHHPHAADILPRMAPVALGVEIAEVELVLPGELDGGGGAGDFASDEGLAAQRAFMVE